MTTIDRLVKEFSKAPGDIKIKDANWDNHLYFIPYFKDSEGDWFGLNSENEFETWVTDDDVDWRVYVGPKKKKKLYQWAIKNQGEGHWFTTRDFYEELPDMIRGNRTCVRVEGSMIEVDEE